MKVLTIDVETTISNKGNPFDQTNQLVMVGLKFLGEKQECIKFPCSHEDWLYIQGYIDKADILSGFNIKFDLHWLRKLGINFDGKRIWDCQIGEFILANQKTPYPALNDAAEKYGFEKKIDVVKEQYWDKGIDTTEIPTNILSDYLAQDLILTENVFKKQEQLFRNDVRYKIFKLQCLDLLVLEEIEWNGIKFDTKKALEKADNLKNEIDTIYNQIVGRFDGIPINLSSNDHISCLLYGGIITITNKIPIGVYKTGAKVGQVRYKNIDKEYILPRLVEPLEGTEVKKPEGSGQYWKVNETVLRKLKLNKQAKELVKLLNRYSELEKLCGTYLTGYSKLIEKMNWEKDTLHGNLNQCVAVTGRLSSTQPNLQNADPQTKIFMETRYE